MHKMLISESANPETTWAEMKTQDDGAGISSKIILVTESSLCKKHFLFCCSLCKIQISDLNGKYAV